MDFRALVQAMTPATYEKMAAAASTGRWADGQMVLRSKAELKAEMSTTSSIARFSHDDL